MRLWVWSAGLSLFLGACAPMDHERLRDYNEIGVELYQRGEFADARDCFDAALRLAPDDTGLVFDLAQCHDQLGDRAKAEELYKQCLEKVPNHPECRHALAVLLVRQQRRDEAATMIDDWLEREPRLGDAYAEHGWLLHQQGDLPRAHARLQQALQFDPQNVRALTELGLIFEAMNRPERALVLYERALQIKPRQPDLTHRVQELKKRGVERPKPD
jgi:Flp pilus assembly protein TadD